MNYRIKDIPKEERPRERLKEVGAESLTNKELLAIILKSGTKGKNVEELALEILNNHLSNPCEAAFPFDKSNTALLSRRSSAKSPIWEVAK